MSSLKRSTTAKPSQGGKRSKTLSHVTRASVEETKALLVRGDTGYAFLAGNVCGDGDCLYRAAWAALSHTYRTDARVPTDLPVEERAEAALQRLRGDVAALIDSATTPYELLALQFEASHQRADGTLTEAAQAALAACTTKGLSDYVRTPKRWGADFEVGFLKRIAVERGVQLVVVRFVEGQGAVLAHGEQLDVDPSKPNELRFVAFDGRAHYWACRLEPLRGIDLETTRRLFVEEYGVRRVGALARRLGGMTMRALHEARCPR